MRDDAPPDPPSRLRGFNAYADDRPRTAAQSAPPAGDDWDEAWTGAVVEPPGARLNSLHRRRRNRIAIASATVAVIGLGALFAAQSLRSPPQAGPAIAAANPPMRIELAQPAAPAAPLPSTERLEVLASLPQSAQPRMEPSRTPERVGLAPPPATSESSRRLAAPEAPPVGAFARDAAGAAGPLKARDACQDGSSWAAALVCRDRELSNLDQRMRRAYAGARDAGVPEAALREDQRDWLDIREEAARHSRNAVEDIYRQRIDELQQAATADF